MPENDDDVAKNRSMPDWKSAPNIDWGPVRARIEEVIPDPVAIVKIEQETRGEVGAMSDTDWEGHADRQQMAIDVALVKAAQYLKATLESQHLPAYVFARTYDLESVSKLTDRVVRKIQDMLSQEWAAAGSEARADLFEMFDRVIKYWKKEQKWRARRAGREMRLTLSARWTRKAKARRKWRDIDNILTSLPPMARTVVGLCKLHGYSVQRIADELEVDPDEVTYYLEFAADAFSNREERK